MLVFVMAQMATRTSKGLQRSNSWLSRVFSRPSALSQATLDIPQSRENAPSSARSLRQLADPAQAAVSALIVCISLALWNFSLTFVNISAMSDLGMVSVLPLGSFIALGGLTLGFCLALLGARERTPTWILALYLISLIYMLYYLPTVVEQVPRFQVTYWLAGHTEYLMRTGSVARGLDAYFNWPGFFILAGLLTAVTGSQTSLVFASWASLIYNLLYLAPLYMIYSTATRDRRLIWLGLWLFYITDWVWQDYFSPQGLNLFIYLVIIAALLKWFRTSRSTPRYSTAWTSPHARMISIETRPISLRATLSAIQQRARALIETSAHPLRFVRGLGPRLRKWFALSDGPSTPAETRRRVALLVVIIGIFFFSVSSHPITPLFIVLSVGALAVCRQIRPRWLPFLMAAMIIGWDFTIAWPYMVGHIGHDLAAFGNLRASTSANVSHRLAVGSADHQIVAQIRVGMTAAIWGLAVLGAALRWRRDSTWYAGDASWGTGSLFAHDLKYVLLATAPMFMVVAQAYGGEMAMRAFLFTLPIVAFFAAAAFCTPDVGFGLRPLSALSTSVTTLTCLILLAGFLFARYGNERADYFTYNETNAVAYLYSVAPPHSLLLQGWTGTPWRYADLDRYVYFPLFPGYDDAQQAHSHQINGILSSASNPKYPASFVIFTRSQQAQAEMFYSVPASDFRAVEAKLIQSGRFIKIYSNTDADILMYVPITRPHTTLRPPITDTPIARRYAR